MGYIGVELVEVFEVYGKEVMFIDSVDCILNKYFDSEFMNLMEIEFENWGVKLVLN